MKKYLIAGGGVAAFEAANALRGLDPDAEITMFSRENVLPYRRPALPRALVADLPEAQFLLKPASFYQEKKIAVELGVEVVAIDRANQTIRLDYGDVRSFDALLLALGGSCFRPPVPGIHSAHTVVLRDWSDTLHLRNLIASGKKKVALIGGGLLGLELADALLRCGCQVTVIEGCPRLLPRQLDEAGSASVLETVSKIPGFAVELGRLPREIGPDKVILADGTVVAAELVVISAGMRPETTLAAAAGLAADKEGITVDGAMRTSDSRIFAAGDCAALDGAASPGLYGMARTTGAVAGRNMAGAHETYQPVEYPARMIALGIKLIDGKLSK
ncbi:MAG: NAD(P)/FAD-dependent oxidoreductase [Victivallaceae bacterium]